ncbi:MAG TPA: ATP-binding cassette domain-containing protein [Acidiferrobacterales bacterium]|nr:ATP-binding cassette domain-containing protein [Acidiferrobacterales bacterium]
MFQSIEARSTPVMRARGLYKRYGEHSVVQGIDLDIYAGECVGLLGPNGAGKTTTLRMLLGLSPPTAGSLDVLGYPVPQCARQMRARAGVVPQQDNLDPDFTVRENLLVYGRYYGLAGVELARRIPPLLAFAALEAKAEAPIATLSGGMRRRLSIARALINVPELLFLDEPTTGLDPQARHLIWQRLRSLRSEGKTLLLTTHYMEEAQRLCDRVVILDQGNILDVGSPGELIARHIEPHVVEVSGDGVKEWLQALGQAHVRRAELVGETVFCYMDKVDDLLQQLRLQDKFTYLHRPANLEDVFLKLTGRDLRD